MPVDDVGCTEEDAKWQRKHRALWHSQQGKCRQDFCKWVLSTECMFLYFCLLASSCWLVRSCVLSVRNRTRFLVRCALNLAACKQKLDKFDEVQQYVGRNTALHCSVSEFAEMKYVCSRRCKKSHETHMKSPMGPVTVRVAPIRLPDFARPSKPAMQLSSPELKKLLEIFSNDADISGAKKFMTWYDLILLRTINVQYITCIKKNYSVLGN